MKKTTVFLIGLLTVLLTFSINCFAQGAELGFSAENKTISVSLDDENEFVNISVMPTEFYEKSELTQEELESGCVILKTVKTEQGVLIDETQLQDDFPVGTYVLETCGKNVYKRIFVNSQNAVLEAVSSQFGDSKNAQQLLKDNLAQLGFNSAVFNKYAGEITELLKYYDDVYDDFADSFLLAEGVTLAKKGEMTFKEMLSFYGGIISYDLENTFSALDEDAKKEFEIVAKKQEFKNKKFEEVFDDIKILASINANGKKAGEELLKFLEENDVDLDDYEDLSSYNKDVVLGEVTSSKYESVEDLIDSFTEITEEYSESKGGSSGGGGGGKSSGGSSFSAAPVTEEEQKQMFSDVKNHWAKADIEKMAAEGIVSGFSDGTFKPEGKITRAEFAKIICKVLSLSEASGDKFTDVGEKTWFAPFVYAATEHGLINGVADNLFAPDENITREDATVILYRLLAKEGVMFDAKASFADSEFISDYARDAVAYLAADGIIKGANGAFNPKNNLTRAEAVTLISRISAYIK